MLKKFYNKANINIKIIAFTLCFFIPNFLFSNTEDIKICITQIVNHPSLDQVYQGISDVLKENGINPEEQIIYKVAHGNISTSTQIAQSFLDEKPSVIISISTPSAQTVKSVLKKQTIPHVFTAVTDPISAGLLQDMKPLKYIVGVLDVPPLEKQVHLVQSLKSDIKIIGVMYNPGEANSVATIKQFTALAEQNGLSVVSGTVTNTTEVMMVANRLMDKVDIIYVPQDNLVVSAMQTLAAVAKRHKKPVITADSGSVRNGALATVGIDYYKIGRETGNCVLKYIEDHDALIQTTAPDAIQSYVNVTTEKEIGLAIQDKLQEPVTVYH